MQMMRAKCGACSWVFDLAALPGRALDVAETVKRRAVCPLCYDSRALMAEARPLSDDERAAKGLGPLGAASATASPAEVTP